MQSKPEIIVPVSPLDNIFQHWHDLEGTWVGDYFHCRDGHRFHKNPWNVAEVEKTAEIKDNFGFLRFKVYLYTTMVQDQEDRLKKKAFEVSVTSFMYNNEEQTIFTSDPFVWLKDADLCYEDNLKRYSMIAKVETMHYQDIRIYAEKIGYHHVEKCCSNCRWCMMKHGPHHHRDVDPYYRPVPPAANGPKRHKVLVCTNYKLFAKRLTDIEKPGFDCLKIQPEVEGDFVCNSFEKRLPPNDPHFNNHCYDQYGDDLPPEVPRQ